MEKITSKVHRLMEYGGLGEETLPKEPVVELVSDRRVLIENHRSVIQYCTDQIRAKVDFGAICVRGRNLRLRYMSGDKLVILGQIEQIDVKREG